jgi:DNA-directed RNA polymerase subunit L
MEKLRCNALRGEEEMKVKMLKKTKNELRIEVEGIGHTIGNILQRKLAEGASVDLAGYDVPHPLAYSSVIYVRTKGNVKPEEALLEAVEKVRDLNKEFSKELHLALKRKT